MNWKKNLTFICFTLIIILINSFSTSKINNYFKNIINVFNNKKTIKNKCCKKSSSSSSCSSSSNSSSCSSKTNLCKKKLQTVALLELSNGIVDFDNNLKLTFEYYFATSTLFDRFPIVDTTGSVTKSIQLLNYYYNKGYRIFIGFSSSSVLQGVLSWFQSHPDAIGISPNSTADSLSIAKNIYRLSVPDSLLISNISLSPFILSRDNIYYVYSGNQASAQGVLNLLLSNPIIGTKIKPYAINSDNSNNTVQDLTNLFNGSNPTTDIVITYLYQNNQNNIYLNNVALLTQLPSPILPLPTFDISLQSFPVFNDLEKIVFNKIYYTWTTNPLSSSELWRQGYNQLKNDYSSFGLNVLQLNNYLSRKVSLTELSNYGFVQQFDTVTKDNKYFSLLNYIYIDNAWTPQYVLALDPIVGNISYQIQE